MCTLATRGITQAGPDKGVSPTGRVRGQARLPMTANERACRTGGMVARISVDFPSRIRGPRGRAIDILRTRICSGEPVMELQDMTLPGSAILCTSRTACQGLCA
jgi:hypothetical protein